MLVHVNHCLVPPIGTAAQPPSWMLRNNLVYHVQTCCNSRKQVQIASNRLQIMLMLAKMMLDASLNPESRPLLPELLCHVSKGTIISDRNTSIVERNLWGFFCLFCFFQFLCINKSITQQCWSFKRRTTPFHSLNVTYIVLSTFYFIAVWPRISVLSHLLPPQSQYTWWLFGWDPKLCADCPTVAALQPVSAENLAESLSSKLCKGDQRSSVWRLRPSAPEHLDWLSV